MAEKMKLYRSVRDKKLTGLCGGLAETFNVDVTVLRLVVLISSFFSGGTVAVIYILASIVIPQETDVYKDYTYDKDPYYRQKETREHQQYEPQSTSPNIDDMMSDIEKKAMWKEIEELRAKIAEFEKGEK